MLQNILSVGIGIFVIGILIFAYLYLKSAGIFKTCPEGSFKHGLTDQCYKCPEGYVRSLDPDINSPGACRKACSGGGFEHWLTGRCYKCPDGFERSLNPNINAPDACIATQPCNLKYGTVVDSGETWGPAFEHWLSGDCYSCPSDSDRSLNPDPAASDACIRKTGCSKFDNMKADNVEYGSAFQHMLSGTCYACPKNFVRSINPDISAGNACVAKGGCESISTPVNEGGFRYSRPFEHMFSGTCFSCPDGYERTLSSIDAEDACISSKSCKDINAGKYPEYGDAFEHWLTGKCYACPKGYTRTIWDISGPNACEQGFLGKTDYAKQLLPRSAKAREMGSINRKAREMGRLISSAKPRGKVQAYAIPGEKNTANAIWVGTAE